MQVQHIAARKKQKRPAWHGRTQTQKKAGALIGTAWGPHAIDCVIGVRRLRQERATKGGVGKTDDGNKEEHWPFKF